MKEHILAALREELERWEEQLSRLSEQQVVSQIPASGWSIKDHLTHLWAWQQRSIARVEAALQDRAPEFPSWHPETDPETENNHDRTNQWIYETYRHRPWSEVHSYWRNSFLHFIELAGQIPERRLLDSDHYPWLEGYPLAVYLLSSYNHHREHFEMVQAGLADHK